MGQLRTSKPRRPAECWKAASASSLGTSRAYPPRHGSPRGRVKVRILTPRWRRRWITCHTFSGEPRWASMWAQGRNASLWSAAATSMLRRVSWGSFMRVMSEAPVRAFWVVGEAGAGLLALVVREVGRRLGDRGLGVLVELQGAVAAGGEEEVEVLACSVGVGEEAVSVGQRRDGPPVVPVAHVRAPPLSPHRC